MIDHGYIWATKAVAALLICCMPLIAHTQEQQLFQGKQVAPPNDRLHIQNQRDLVVATAVPSREETRQIFGADLYLRNVQPVWVQVENHSEFSASGIKGRQTM